MFAKKNLLNASKEVIIESVRDILSKKKIDINFNDILLHVFYKMKSKLYLL